jgi:glycosyltransferase involved in cell wall biosynthesis
LTRFKTKQKPVVVDELLASGVKVEDVSQAPMLERIGRADAIHVHGLWESLIRDAGRVAKRLDRLFVVSPHGMATDWALQQRRLKKLAYRWVILKQAWPADLMMHFTTEWERQRSRPWSKRQRSVVIPLGTDLPAIQTAVATQGPVEYWRQRLGEGPPTLLFVGRVHPGKGVEYLVPAMQHVPPEVGRLAIVGPADSMFAAGLKRHAQDLGVVDRVHWLGPVYPPELYAAMGDAAALVLPSDHENFGLVAVEAIAAGTPALVSREVAAGRELVESGAGIWVSREPDKLGQELRAYLAAAGPTPNNCTAMADRFNLHRVGGRWNKVYCDALSHANKDDQ